MGCQIRGYNCGLAEGLCPGVPRVVRWTVMPGLFMKSPQFMIVGVSHAAAAEEDNGDSSTGNMFMK